MPRVRNVIVYRFRHIGSLFWRTWEGPFVNSGTKNFSRMNIGTISHTDRRNSKFFHCIYARMGQSRIFEKFAIESGGCFSSHTRLPWCKIRPFGFLTKCRTCLKQRTEMSWWHHTNFSGHEKWHFCVRMGQIGVVFLDLGITMNFSNVFWGCLAMEILIIFIHRLPARLL